jgi:transmembrane sensor
MSEARAPSSDLLEEAADWFIRVRTGRTDSEVHAAWLAWIEADPAHRAAFASVQEIWDVVDQVQPPPWPRPEELASAEAIEPPSTVVDPVPGAVTPATVLDVGSKVTRPLVTASSARQRRPKLRRWSAVAACAATLLIALFAIRPNGILDGSRQRIATARGEQQSAVLPDGSRVELGGLTGVEVAFTAERRLIVADEGEAFYKVERDPARPFVVQAGPVTVTAVGTAFAVRREGDTVSVVVIEGQVEVNAGDATRTASIDAPVASVRAKAGQRVRFERGQLAPTAQPIHTEPVTRWWRGQLRFEEEPLGVVVASLNRYSERRIVIADPTLAELRFTGTVFDDSVEDWLKAVPVVFPVALDESDPHRVLIVRRQR